MDLKAEKTPESVEKATSSPSNQMKSCSSCQTTKTPLWRGGPSGPKSLCNACGIKYNKKRRQQLGLETVRTAKKKQKKNSTEKSDGIREILKRQLIAFGSEMMLQRSGKLMNKLKEEEQAAILLMSLSCGSVSA